MEITKSSNWLSKMKFYVTLRLVLRFLLLNTSQSSSLDLLESAKVRWLPSLRKSIHHLLVSAFLTPLEILVLEKLMASTTITSQRISSKKWSKQVTSLNTLRCIPISMELQSKEFIRYSKKTKYLCWILIFKELRSSWTLFRRPMLSSFCHLA